MSNTYLKKLANILEMLHNLDRDLNLVGLMKLKKKYITQLPLIFITLVNVIFLMSLNHQAFLDQLYTKLLKISKIIIWSNLLNLIMTEEKYILN